MKLSLRFALDNLFVIGAAFLAVSAVAFSAPVAGWRGRLCRPRHRLPGPGGRAAHGDGWEECGGPAVGGLVSRLAQATGKPFGLLQPLLYAG